jgi:two-component system phosphate regulon sensor histidine kinase PhoR
MKQDWRNAVKRTIMGFVFAGLIGVMFDLVAWSLAITGMGYLIWHYIQLNKLQSWLETSEINDPPYSYGLWGALFDDVYRLQRRQRKSRKRLKGVIRRVQDSTTALRDGVLMVNSSAELEWWNEAAGNLLGLKEQHDIGHPITNLVRAPEFKEYFEHAQYDQPLELVSPINQEQVLQIHLTLFGKKDRLIVCRDITHMKQLEAMRQDFIANASHELRTPLTVISGYLETLIEYGDSFEPRWGRALNQMHQQSQRMQSLIDDLLMLSRLENSDDFQHVKVPLKSVLTRIENDAKAFSAGKHTITLDCEDINVMGNESELNSAFSNLIFNAVKYTPEGGNVDIKCCQNKKGIYFSVTDNGLGIDSLHIPRLTERFYRADPSRHSETGGTGLGLAIVKHVLLRHEGKLTIESFLGHGSTFTCYLPNDKAN